MSTAAQENSLVKAALEYAGYGWRVIPLHNLTERGCSCNKGSSCATPGKHPRPNAWQKAATTDEEVIVAWWEKWPKANVGVVFGKDSGIIDAECDSGEEEDILRALFGGEIPPTISFKSSRGRHWLFKWRDDLPAVGIHHCGRLAIRLGCDERGAMSVFPPSIHPSGLAYQWLTPPGENDLAEIPDDVLARIVNADSAGEIKGKPKKTQEHWDRVTGHVSEGERNDSIASVVGKLFRMVGDLNDDSAVQMCWRSAVAFNDGYRPPLSEAELRNDFLGILEREQRRRKNEDLPALPHLPENQIAGAIGDAMKGFRLVVLSADPPLYELHSSLFSNAKNSCIILNAEQLVCAREIKIEALKQAKYPLPKRFSKWWDGVGDKEGLYEQLVRNASERDAPQELKRQAVIAELLLAKIARAHILQDGKEPGGRGTPIRLQDGSVIFEFTTVFEDLRNSADKVSRFELSGVLSHVRAKRWKKRWQRLDAQCLDALFALSSGCSVDPQDE
jgi:hypothetical protein